MTVREKTESYKRREIIHHRQDLKPKEPIALVDALVMRTVCYIDVYDKAGRQYGQIICKPGEEYDQWMSLLTENREQQDGKP